MIAYASRTGTRRNLAALRNAGWRLMISAKGVQRSEGFRYALDNGAWHAFVNKRPFDGEAFLVAYRQLGPGADFVVLPDIVAGGFASLAFSLKWREDLGVPVCPQLLAVQDGMNELDVAGIIGPSLGVFVGGTDWFKESTMLEWGRITRERDAYFHVGRVNTVRRIYLCEAAGADSFDGSAPSRYAVELPKLENARHQIDLFKASPPAR